MIRTKKHFCFCRCSVKICTALRQCPFAGLPSQLSSHQQHWWTLILFKVISGETVRWHLRLQLLWCHVVVSFGFGSQSLALKSNFKDFKIFPVLNKIIKSLDLCPGVWEYHSVLHGTPLVFCAQCSVPVGKLGPHFVNPERASVTPRAFDTQENYSVPSDQNTGCGRLQHHDGSYINPSRKPTGSKGFRSLALNAFLLATCRQALELFYWQLRETSFDSEVKRKRWLLPFPPPPFWSL